MGNFAVHSDLLEKMKWTTWGRNAREREPERRCLFEMWDNVVVEEGSESESNPCCHSSNTITGPRVTSGGVLIPCL